MPVSKSDRVSSKICKFCDGIRSCTEKLLADKTDINDFSYPFSPQKAPTAAFGTLNLIKIFFTRSKGNSRAGFCP